jgi:hypothetical protein
VAVTSQKSFDEHVEFGLEAFERAFQGFGNVESPIDPCENTYEFVRKYNLRIDGQPFDWVRYRHLVPVFEDTHRVITLMFGAQSGKSVLLMSNLVRYMLLLWGSLFGYYFPDFFLPRAFSKERFKPFLLSSDELAPWLGAETLKKGKGSDAILSRSFGPSTVFFLSTQAKTATEGLPMPAVFFDEVRRMEKGDVQRAVKRTSSFEHPVVWKVSTAKYPESDIHAAFLDGDQRFFHTACKCADGIVLPLRFPDCILDLTRATPQTKAKVAHAFSTAGVRYLDMDDEARAEYGEACYVCPSCGTIITDPREGWWEPHAPQHYAHSYQASQLLTMPAARVYKEYARPAEPLDEEEFWNSTLGLPKVLERNRLTTEEEVRSCIDDNVPWAARQPRAWRAKHLKNTAMGIDQMGRFNCVVIKGREPNGKYKLLHLEVTHGDDTWKRCAQLMFDYDVRICVADKNPNFNDSFDFARAFRARVWLATYAQDVRGKSKMIDWKDRKKAMEGQRQQKDTKWKWDVIINLRTALEWSLGRFKRRENVIPNPRTLIQELPRQRGKVILSTDMREGQWEPVPICEDVYIPHMTKMVRTMEYLDEEHEAQRDYRMRVKYLGNEDPHFVFANLFCDIACARLAHGRREEEG